ncbi:MAG: MATE family efflux transporter [Anaerolineae bacterium]|jgi:putative MATE family efflux protein|nr:MATE family efflux transporter [Anaerolineae bacterium]MBT7071925.1 MATE family efflux transporter [Anaerolineae bacterium]MBT7323939.1 MATE family efflux transporter [Anaerolineae bacterium]
MNLSFFRDKEFIRKMLSLAIPVAFQQFITAGLNMVDVLMVGQLGEAAIAALGLANQVFFLFIILLFGVTSGMAIFTAQFWGNGDEESIHKVLGISLSVATLVGIFFSLAATLFPETILRFYTEDSEVIALASSYLRIVGLSYIFTAIVTSYYAVLRSIMRVKLTVVVSVIALILKSILSYLLIFGIGGLPALGVRGAAIATAFGWLLQFILILVLVYTLKTPLAVNPLTFFRFERAFLFRVLGTAMPAAINEVFWSVGITVYNAVYAHISTGAMAAVQINTTIEEIAFVLLIGLGNACAIMIGNEIGAGDKDVAFEHSRRFLIIGVLLAILLGIMVLFIREPVISLYEISPRVAASAFKLMTVFSFTLWLRSINFILFIGALRAGGDTRFAMYMEIFSVWLIGVPAALIGGFVLHLPVEGVYLLVLTEELVKLLVIFRRFLSRKWIHDLVGVPVA